MKGPFKENVPRVVIFIIPAFFPPKTTYLCVSYNNQHKQFYYTHKITCLHFVKDVSSENCIFIFNLVVLLGSLYELYSI